mmetsp:Transcript_46480/g.129117  ORF Transcript_46480/g.129117 Transcript_46480/m.129117 type:complete len:225 (+) Transcript_46480:39-713(+)
MLATGLITALAFAPTLTVRHAPAAGRAAAAMSAADDMELQVVKRLQESFWTQKRARMKADMEARLMELEEFEAREAALSTAVSSTPLLGASTEVAALQAELAAERAMRQELEATLTTVREEAELNLQKTAAYWIAKLDAAKEGAALPAAAEPAAAAPKAAVDDLVAGTKILTSELSLTELRSRLVASGLSTVGLKSELMERLENVMQHERLKFQSWDPETLAWV